MEIDTYSLRYMRGLTFREALNVPEVCSLHVTFFIITMIFVWQPTAAVITLLIGYWVFDFAVVGAKWYLDNRRHPISHRPPFRNPS